MPHFGRTSLKRLETCHPDLQALCHRVIELMDFSVLEGTRSKARQDYLYRRGQSKVPWPHSKHNVSPSLAVDIAPYPIDWQDEGRFYLLAGHMLMRAADMGLLLRFGGDWDRDYDIRDQTFNDLAHFELVD
jgi:peptidoglycan LD-endopeptidase CwlK